MKHLRTSIVIGIMTLAAMNFPTSISGKPQSPFRVA